MHAFLATVIIA